MIESLKERVTQALQKVSAATVSTKGPGGIQAGFFPCEALGLTIFFLIPAASDVLFNLESEKDLVVTTPKWQMEGESKVLNLSEAPANLALVQSPRASGCVLVAVSCCRIHFSWDNGWGYRETIDCQQESIS